MRAVGKVVQIAALTTLALLALAYVAIAVYGAFIRFSPTPFWDMWDGELDFFMKIHAGEGWRWFSQHNEHRIVLSRVLFWLDLTLFGGRNVSLIVANYLIVLGGFATFVFYLRDRLGGWTKPTFWLLITPALAFCYSWIQENNLTWGFQSQFFLAQVVPLAALFFLSRAETGERFSARAWLLFAVACILGVAAAGSMANGILCLPVMVVAALLMRSRRIFILLILSAVVVALYLHGYSQPPAHGSLVDTFLHHTADAVKFILTYLGGPFSYIPHLHQNTIVPMIAGAFLIGGATVAFVLAMIDKTPQPSRLALLAFIGYIIATAALTAGGRAFQGDEAALASRYMTPALMGWIALAFVFAPEIDVVVRRAFPVAALPPLLLLAAFAPNQLEALKPWDQTAAERRLGSLALALGVRDEAAIGRIYPFIDRALDIGKRAADQNLSVFSTPALLHVRSQLGQPSQNRPSGTCGGKIESVAAVSGEPKMMRVSAWLSGVPAGKKPKRIELLDPQRRIVGWAVVGSRDASPGSAEHVALQGYVLPEAAGGDLTISTLGGACEVTLHSALPPFEIMLANSPLTVEPGLATQAALIDVGAYSGSDFKQTSEPGIAVYASRINGDADTGEITLHMRRGQFIYFTSGPTPGNQVLTVIGDDRFKAELPATEPWIKLMFTDTRLPETFDIKLSDNGAGWGEWSGIALATAPKTTETPVGPDKAAPAPSAKKASLKRTPSPAPGKSNKQAQPQR